MTIAGSYLPEFDQEMARTRRMLALVPEDRFDFAPHPKSMKLGRLASHIAEMPRWATVTMTTELLEPPPDMKGFDASTLAQLQEEFESRVVTARDLLEKATDEDLAVTWTVHHRAQLGVYLRLLDVPIPGTYGPSADEM